MSPVLSCGGSVESPYGVIDLEGSPILPENLAVYVPVPVNARAQVAPYVVPPDLSGVAGLDRRSLAPGVLSGLKEKGFAVVAGGEYDYVFQPYMENPGAKFVTVDAVYQAFLGMCMGIRWELERVALRRELESLVVSLLEVLEGMYDAARGAVRRAAGKALGFMGVAAALLGLDPRLPPEVGSLVEEEVTLVEEASEARISPLFGRREDYRVYEPQGLYARYPDLARFHRAVDWLGRWEVFPAGGEGGAALEERREAARITALLVGALHTGKVDNKSLLVLWDHLYQVTRFLSCRTVSLNAVSAGRVLSEVLGKRFPLSRLEDEALVDRLAEALEREAGGPGDEKDGLWGAWGSGFRFLEACFEPGTGVFLELGSENVPERKRPRSLDLPAALGSDRALQLLDGFYGEASLPGYKEKVRELRGETSSIEPAWTRACLAWSLLKNAVSLLRPPREGYPAFMQSDPWKDRDLYLFLASWVDGISRDRAWKEMEGDVVPGRGGVAGSGGVTGKGYVEPRPEAYALLAADADLLRRGLEERGLLGEEMARKLDSFYRLSMGLKSMAEKELLNQPLSPEEYQLLADFGELLLELVSMPAEEGNGYLVPDPSTVLEVYRDQEEGTVLQMALGKPAIYYVIAPVEGRPTLTVGAGYSLYELVDTLDTAPTPEEWRLMVESGQVPEASAWTSSFMR
ncbi:MAG: DUF3160 domain-containing protein [Actinomycetota bacterium]|nr:DUF3160 domain-containing protein [Actinomycetota bacterium]